MLKNYLKIAFRNLWRNKAYATINVLGLALGMTCAIIIFSMVKYHLSFDNFHKDSDRIYRIVTEKHRDIVTYDVGVPSPLGKAFRNDYTFGEKTARIYRLENELITIQNQNKKQKFKEEYKIAFVEGEFFDIFNFPLLEGNKNLVLAEPNTAIITQKMAKKYFGKQDPMGKIIILDNRINLRITGILKDIPQNTDQQIEVYASFITLKSYDEEFDLDSWGGIRGNMHCFTKLRPNVTVAQVERIFPAYVKKYRPQNKNVHHYKLQALADVHFNPLYEGVITKSTLWTFSFIGLFLVVIACVNFINLATAQALNRAKEVGVRKVLGGLKIQLFWQFMSETALITFISAVIAIALSEISFPFVNQLFETQITFNFLTDWQLSLFMLGLVLIVTFFAGAYPGFILARFQPVKALKGKLLQHNVGGFNTRRTLIISQFTISQALIIGVIVITNQMRYVRTADLGFDKEAIVMIQTGSQDEKMKTLKKQFQQIAGVESVSACFVPPSSSGNNGTDMRYESRKETESFRFIVKAGDSDYLKTFGLKLVAGRNLFPSDSVREYLVNEVVAKKLSLKSPEELIGKMITVYGVKAPIVGVIKDFHDESLHQEIHPLFIANVADQLINYAVKINLANTKGTLEALETAWSKMYPEQVYEFEFLDKQIAEFYKNDETLLSLIQIFSIIAIFISCLGLYGLVNFMATQKTKEIGIRKVLGATTEQILSLFGKEFGKLILIAFFIASPIAWWVMNGWLQNYQYRISIDSGVFLLSIGITILISSLTVSYQAIKAAIANPVDSLRIE